MKKNLKPFEFMKIECCGRGSTHHYLTYRLPYNNKQVFTSCYLYADKNDPTDIMHINYWKISSYLHGYRWNLRNLSEVYDKTNYEN